MFHLVCNVISFSSVLEHFQLVQLQACRATGDALKQTHVSFLYLSVTPMNRNNKREAEVEEGLRALNELFITS